MRPRICFLAGRFNATDAILVGLAAYSREHGPWRLEVKPATDSAILASLKRAGYAGIISSLRTAQVTAALKTVACPVVSVGSERLAETTPCVLIDDLAVGAMAAQHLMDLGYRHFGFFGLDMPFGRNRFAGFARALKKRRLTCLANYANPRRETWHDWDGCQNERRVRAWLGELKTPSGVMACSDFMARLLVDVCGSMGLHVPEDIAIVGVDNNLSHCESDAITLSSVDPDSPRMGYEAAGILDRLMRGEPPPAPVVVQPRALVQRRSTGQFAFADPEVSAAMRYLHANACEGIGVDAVCRHISISRRQLERRFRAAMQRSPGEQIRRLRMTRARDLLLRTALSLTDVSTQCGFEYLSHFSTAFKQFFGTNPRKYRQNHAAH